MEGIQGADLSMEIEVFNYPYHHLGIIEDSKVLILAWSEMHPSLFKNMQLTNWLLPPEVLL